MVANEAGILLLTADRTGKRLHRYCIYKQPLLIMSWMEFGDSNKVLNGAANLKDHILAAISDDSSTSLEKVLIIIKDIFRRLAESEELGIAWKSDNFNCTRVDCLFFRKKILEKKAKRVADEEKAEMMST